MFSERRKDFVHQDKDNCLWLRKIDGLSRDLRGLKILEDGLMNLLMSFVSLTN